MQEINELKNLVVQSLEAHGVLGQLRAQIRSSVFKIIDMQEVQNNKRQNSFFWENPLCQKIYESQFGAETVELIMEMLQFYKMDYSLSVFPHEANVKEEITREKLVQKLNFNDSDKGVPLLFHIIKLYFSGKINTNPDTEKALKEEEKVNSKSKIEDIKPELSKKETNSKEINLKENDLKEIKKPNTNQQAIIEPLNKEITGKDVFKKKDETKQNQNEILPEIPKQKPNVPTLQTISKPTVPEKNDTDDKKNFENNNFDFQGNNSGISDIDKEKKTLVEAQNKLGDLGKKINNKQIAEISASRSDKKDLSQSSENKNLESSMKRNPDRSDEYDEEFEEEVGEEIYEEDLDMGHNERFDRDGNQQMNRENDQELGQFSEEMLGASQSQGFDIMVNSQTLEEYDYYEDVMNP